jgi:hypothetical protein
MSARPTETMLRWLNTVRQFPGTRRSRSRTGYVCMQRGWTEWNYRVLGAERAATAAEAREVFGDRWWGHVEIDGERITDEGLRVLREAGDWQPVFRIAV